MLPLLEAFLCQFDIVVWRPLRLLDEAVKQDHLRTIDREERSRNASTQIRAHFPNGTTQVIDTRLANRPLELNVCNVLADCLSLILGKAL